MTATLAPADLDVERCFPPRPYSSEFGAIKFSELAYISKPITEEFHKQRPTVVIAGDRGGRLFAWAVFQSWKRRYPAEPFPTLDGGIQFARITSRSAPEENVIKATHSALERAGLPKTWKKDKAKTDSATPKVVYMDDWACHGDTARRFINAARKYGLPKSALTFATMCGPDIGDIGHIIGDPSRDPRSADWNDNSYYSGVEFYDYDGVTPTPVRHDDAAYARQEILRSIDDYYRDFSVAIACGSVAACACIANKA